MALNISRQGKVYVVAEGSFGDEGVTFASANAMRHKEYKPTFDPFQRVKTDEKKFSPGAVTFFDRKVAGAYTLAAKLRPSGTLNTLPEMDPVLKAAFGSVSNITLSTTVGIKALVAALAGAGAGNVDNGAHEYYTSFVDAFGETKLSTLATASVVDKTANGKVSLSAIPVGPTGTTARKIWRTAAGLTGIANAKLLTTLADNTTVVNTDNTADSGLGAAAPVADTSHLLTDKKTFFLLSVTGLAVGQGVAFNRGGTIYLRRIATLSGNNLTIDNALPTAAAFGDVVKGTTTYLLTTDLALTLGFLHVLPNFRRQLLGAHAETFALQANANDEVQLTIGGMAKKQFKTAEAAAAPGDFITVGGNPPTTNSGDLWIGDSAYKHKNFGLSIKYGLKLRDEEAGTDGYATESYRSGERSVNVTVDAFAETEATLYDVAHAGTLVALLRQFGRTEGNMAAVACPSVDFKVPETSDGQTEADWPFQGTARETADALNNEVALILG